MNQITNLRFGCPVDFHGDADAASDYERQCHAIRARLAPGGYEVAPQLQVSTPRGRNYAAGAAVSEHDFDGAVSPDGRVLPGRDLLAQLVADGFVLLSDQQSDDERAALAEHVAMVKHTNSVATRETVAAKLDALVASGRFVRVASDPA